MRDWLSARPMVVMLMIAVIYAIGLDRYEQTHQPGILTLEEGWYTWVMKDYPQEREKTWRLTVDHAYLYLQKKEGMALPEAGDTIDVYTHLKQVDEQGSATYANYMRRQGLYYTGYVRSGDIHIRKGEYHGAGKLRQRLIARYEELGITGQELATLSALTLGYRESLDEDTQRHFRDAGAMHVLAVSGMHTGILYMIILFLCSGMGLRPILYEEAGRRRIAGMITLMLLWGYAALTGWSPSVVRSVVMLSIMEVGRMLYRRSVGLNTLAAAAALILIVRPSDLYSVGMQLSFAAVAAIILLIPKRRYGYVVSLLVMSLAAQVGTLPISSYYFHQVSNWFMISSLIVVPLAGLMMAGSVLCFTIGWIPYVGEGIGWCLKSITWLMNQGVGLIDYMPCATWPITFTPQMAVAYYGMIGCMYMGWKRSWYWLIGAAASAGILLVLY